MSPERPPRVSIAMVAYNQERWIGTAIESALEQSFTDLEVVVGDDGSTDGTLAIARDFAARDPRVRPLPAPKNLGGRPNFVRTLLACRGEFINQLDGDDYFLDRDKLRLQVEWLDAHPDLAGCFGGSQEVDDDGRPLGAPKLRDDDRDRFSIRDFARYCMTDSAAMIFRRGLFGEFPGWFHRAPQGDWPLHMLNAEHGDFGYLNRVLSAYRIHDGGIWNKKTEAQKVAGNLECQRHFLESLRPETVAAIRPVITRYQYGRVKALIRAGHTDAAQLVMDWLKQHGDDTAPLLKVLKAKARMKLAAWRQG